MNDPVNHPRHYTNSAAKCSTCNTVIECIEITRHLSFNIGNAVKYLWRYQDKNGIEDLQKAMWYICDQIKELAKMNCEDVILPEKPEFFIEGIHLDTPKEIMEAFLAGRKLINSEYYDTMRKKYLYLNKCGQICEEDGAVAKSHHVPICMQRDAMWWKVIE